MAAGPSGLLVVDKPAGSTSHDVVDRIRKVFRISRVGHSGTLDPAATGVLLIGLGKATRLLTFVQNLPKSYRARVQFGVTTSSGDRDGEVLATKKSNLTSQEVQRVAEEFWGEIEQIPPMVSAVRLGGERLYKAARRGEVVDRPARTVRIYQIDVEEFDADAQIAQIYVRCSSGTYIRTLATDMGDRLEVGAHLSALRRVAIGSFSESDATELSELEEMGESGARAGLLSMAEAMRDFPRVTVQGEQLDHVTHGRPLTEGGKAPSVAAGQGPEIRTGAPRSSEPPGAVFGGRLAPHRKGELPILAQRGSGDRPAHEAGMTAGIPVAVLNPGGDLIAVYRRSARQLKPAAVLI